MNNNFYIDNDINFKNISYGFFSKNGGSSKNNFSSLNCSYSSGDSLESISKNIKLAKKIIGLNRKKLKFISQTHSSDIKIINKENLKNKIQCDGSITLDKNIALAVLTADCAPIFIFDKNCSIICAVHSGWRGSLNNIVKNAITKIIELNYKRKNLIAIVGPCLSKENFEVDLNLKKLFLNKNIQYKKFFLDYNKKLHFDMRGLINFQLNEASVSKIGNIDIDTYSNKDIFFSHRYSSHKGQLPTGRMINLIGFKDF